MKLALENISVKLSNNIILEDINLVVEEGELISLLGASGCGKSTLLKTVAGLINPVKGNIFLGESDAKNIKPHKRGTVIVFQDLRLFPHMTVLENIYFALKMKGVPKTEYLSIAEEFLNKVHLSGFENRKIKELSGGQMQRVAIARALASSPSILLLDEPFSSLDENLRQDMRELLLVLQREYRITTILVTHDKAEALSLSDKIALMKNGKILQYDIPEQIYSFPKNRDVADFFGDNIYLEGFVKEKMFKSEMLSFEYNLPDGIYSAMFRAKDICLSQEENNAAFRVKEIFYKGDEYEILVESLNEDKKIKLKVDKLYRHGEIVYLKFNIKKGILFAK
ncbi:MAG: ABC transporter ATP-binding protein [Proteocatella sp.]